MVFRFMRSAVISQPFCAEVSQVATPSPGPGEIRVKLEGCGICGSNVPPWEGRPWFRYPLEAGAPGHEGWGFVDALGCDVHEFALGERVAFLSDHAFAEYDLAPANQCLRLPHELDGKPFPAEPLGCAMNVFRRSSIRRGERVAIIGVGFLGAVLVRLAANAGARVTAYSRRPAAIRIAELFGASETVKLHRDSSLLACVDSVTGAPFDCVIEAVGKQETLDLATQLTRERGRLIIAGYHQDGWRRVDMQLWNWRGLDVINAHERDPKVYLEGMQAALDAVLSGALDPTPLYTHTFPLEELGMALETTRRRPAEMLKALVLT